MLSVRSASCASQPPAVSSSVIEGIDYGRLSIQDAVRRLLEVDTDIKVRRIMEEKTVLDKSLGRKDILLPRAETDLSAVKPLRIFYAGSDQAPNLFAEQRLALGLVVDSNSPAKLNRDSKNREVTASELQETTTERTRAIVKTFYEVETYQNGYAYYREAEAEVRALLQSLKGNPKGYSALEKLEVINYFKLVSSKQLTLLGKLKESRGKLKRMLGLDAYDDLAIHVENLPEDAAVIRNLVERSGLRQKSYSVETLSHKLAAAKAASAIKKRPLVSLSFTPELDLLQRQQTHGYFLRQLKGQMGVALTDFGYSSLSNRAGEIEAEIAAGELAQGSYEQKNSDAYEEASLEKLEANIQNYKDYLDRAESVLRLLRERVSLPVDYLLRILDRYYEAKYLLRDNLAQYFLALSKVSDKKGNAPVDSLEYAKLSLGDILKLAAQSADTDERIAEKKEELAATEFKAQKAEVRPALSSTFIIEYQDVSGPLTKSTRATLALDGSVFSGKHEQMTKSAAAALEAARWQNRAVRNKKYGLLLKEYFKMVYYTRALATLGEMQNLKQSILRDTARQAGRNPQSIDMDTNLVYLQNMELNRLKTDVQSFMDTSRAKIRAWIHIPADMQLGVALPPCLETDRCPEDFANEAREEILPNYDPRAAVNYQQYKLDSAVHVEQEATSFGGLLWQLRGELVGPDYDGWHNINRAGVLALTLPWGQSGQKLKASLMAQKRIRAELAYEDESQEYSREKEGAQLDYEAARDMAEALKKSYDDLRAEKDLAEQIYGIGARPRIEIANAKLEVLRARMEYEEAYSNYLYALCMRLLVSGAGPEETRKPPVGRRLTVSGLQNAVDMALDSSRQLQIYRKLIALEGRTPDNISKYHISGSAGADGGRISNKEPSADQWIESVTAMANYEADLIRGKELDKQRARIKIAEDEYESARLGLAADVSAAYTDYFAANAKYEAIFAHYLREKSNLDGMAGLHKSGAIPEMDYLKQRELAGILWSKLQPIIKQRESAKEVLASMLVGASDAGNLPQLDVIDRDGEMEMPLDPRPPRASSELHSVRQPLLDAAKVGMSRRGELEVRAAELNTEIASTRFKSLGVSALYAGGTNSETNYLLYERLGLIATLSNLTEFASLSSSNQIYEPTRADVVKIGRLYEQITWAMWGQEAMNGLQKVKELCEEYEHAERQYEDLTLRASEIEDFARRELGKANAGGRISVIHETEIKQSLLNTKMDRIDAFYKMTAMRSMLDQYSKIYIGKGLDSVAKPVK